jgi:hypothetical protein
MKPRFYDSKFSSGESVLERKGDDGSGDDEEEK